MSPQFSVVLWAAIVLALGFVLLPLLRSDPERRRLRAQIDTLGDWSGELPDDQLQARRRRLEDQLAKCQKGGNLALVLGLLVLIPTTTWLLYQHVGEPEAIDGIDSETRQVRSSLSTLAHRLERDPSSLDDWVVLGLSYKELREYSSAEHALRRALNLDPESAFIRVELAEVLLFASGQSSLPDEARRLLKQALTAQANQQKALWLLGMDAFQQGRHESALDYWQKLRELLPDGSVRASVEAQIERAEQARSDIPEQSSDVAGGPFFPVTVRLDPELGAGLSGQETVFIVARSAVGAGPPLAVRRLRAGDLPKTVRLSDADAMVEGMGLSTQPSIEVVARVSMQGFAEPRPGDFEGRSGPLRIDSQASTEIVIDQVIPAETESWGQEN